VKATKLEVFTRGLDKPPLVFGVDGSGAENTMVNAYAGGTNGNPIFVELPGGKALSFVGIPYALHWGP
jgi:hypothetical protein